MSERRRAVLALAILLPAPSIGTWMGMVAAEGTTLGETFYVASKAWVLLLPVLWLMVVDRKRPSVPRPSGRGM
ncbi:MAG: CPBP family intramembrane metalloprotease, partial [Planctomycetota bacterium]